MWISKILERAEVGGELKIYKQYWKGVKKI